MCFHTTAQFIEPPFQLTHGREPLLPFDATIEPINEDLPKSTNEYYKKMVARLQSWWAAAYERMNDQWVESMNDTVKRNTKLRDYETGDLALLYVPMVPKGVPKKLAIRWHGTYKVTGGRIGRQFAIEMPADTDEIKVRRVQEARLRKYHSRSNIETAPLPVTF